MRRYLFSLLATLFLLTIVAPSTAQTAPTLLDIINRESRYSTLANAIAAADPVVAERLSSVGATTIFAPTNQAFLNLAGLFDYSLDALLADTELLTELLLYHTLDGTQTSATLIAQDGRIIRTLLDGTAVLIVIENGTIRLNGVSRVASPFDVSASNGILHTAADMIFPYGMETRLEALSGVTVTTPRPTRTPVVTTDVTVNPFPSGNTIAGRLASDPLYSTLVEIIATVNPDLIETLNGEDEYTLFAPTNSAFDNLFFSLDITLEEALEMPELLEQIVSYHLVEGVVTSDDLRQLVEDEELLVTIFDNGTFVESIRVAIDGNDRLVLNEVVRITVADLDATNGVIHNLNNVLLPQAVLDALEESEG
ncbi:MAG: fasciclin domain-containing protein [Anaerolineae bacterium]|nr:fasciclin domain-containing protein [Anaerolineae bacterium]